MTHTFARKRIAQLYIPLRELRFLARSAFLCNRKFQQNFLLLKKAAGLDTASGEPNKKKVATLTSAQIREIAELKMPDLNAASVEAAMSMVAGTARSMGIVVED